MNECRHGLSEDCPGCMQETIDALREIAQDCYDDGGPTETAKIAQRALALAQRALPPVDITGWKLVPDSPTEEMWQAGRSADEHPGDSYSKVWRAMFNTAPNVDDCETTSSLTSTVDQNIEKTDGGAS